MREKNIFDVSSQATCETCLPICLMGLIRQKNIKIPDSEELNILIEGIKFTKLDYSTGQLVYICQKYLLNVEQYVDFSIFHRVLSRFKIPNNLKILSKSINKQFIKKMVNLSPVIIYLDKYYLEKIYHYSHFVILISLNDQRGFIFDPWDGRYRKISTDKLMQSIKSLRNKLKISPKLIRII